MKTFLILILTINLMGCGAGSSNKNTNTPNLTQSSDTPVLNFTAATSLVSIGESTTLNWSSNYTTQCIASGNWEGVRQLSGNETTFPLSIDSTFSLTCTNESKSITKTVTIIVNPAPSQSLNFSSNAAIIAPGSNITLTWAADNVDSCTAKNAWSGIKPINGNETLGPITTNSDFELLCTGNGVEISETVKITMLPLNNKLLGSVDSSYINSTGSNKVYIYSGSISPDDSDGDDGDPLIIADVIQQPGTCNWFYSASGLDSGLYTFAFTSDGINDDPNQNDPINFQETYTINYNGGQLQHNLIAKNVLSVGPNHSYKTVHSAAIAANPGDVIEIDAGIYLDDIIVWRTNDLTVRGVSGMAHIKGTKTINYVPGDDIKNGMGLWVVKSDRLTFENIEFSGATVPDENGAGIRNQGNDLSICNNSFHDNENGLLGGAYGTLLIENSEFSNNGFGDGQSHNMYIDDGNKFIIRYSYSHHAKIGHNIKSRAKENQILYNRIMDEVSGTSSYAIDIPNGGLTMIVGNLIQQGLDTDNSTMVQYGAEGLSSDGRLHDLYVLNNTFVNDRSSGAFLGIPGNTSSATIINNIFARGDGTGLGESWTFSNNLISDTPGFVDMESYDYHLTPNSPARDAGETLGEELTPNFQYAHPTSHENRTILNQIDIGALEY